MWWHRPVVPILGRLRREEKELNLCYVVRLLLERGISMCDILSQVSKIVREGGEAREGRIRMKLHSFYNSPYNICSLVYTPRPVTPAPDVESARDPPTDKEHVWNNTVTFSIMRFLPFAVTWMEREDTV